MKLSIFGERSERNASAGKLTALDRAFAVAEYRPDGTVAEANQAFLKLFGYALDEVVGKHQGFLLEKTKNQSPAFKEFWAALAKGEARSGDFERVTKSGEPLWIHAEYQPIMGPDGTVSRVVEIAMDITRQKHEAFAAAGVIDAINASQAVIEFTLDGEIVQANENFLQTLGYTQDAIKGKHHRLFVARNEQGVEYDEFWKKLRAGEFQQGEFRRLARNGDDVYIQATYTPVRGPDGKVIKIVKFATDVTRRVNALNALSAGLEKLANGDLSARVGHSVSGEFAVLRDAFNGTVDKLRSTVGEIIDAVKDMRKSTGEISDGASDLSSRAENQAASLEEVAATMEEMSATVKKNAENAVSASTLSSDARDRADRGGQIVQQAVTAMSEIEAGSGKIADIVSVIDGFAFQTNLLALNAAVEAARAGEAGKGFAVVASEVRTLAQRSADAARDIKALIDQSSGQVKDGVRLVKETGDSLTSIMDAIRQVSETIVEISEASREQSLGVDEITSALTSMDEITQQNSALADESANAARGLGERANGLDQVVSFFSLSGSADAAAFDADARADRAAAARVRASAA